jgi:hypothetical protein
MTAAVVHVLSTSATRRPKRPASAPPSSGAAMAPAPKPARAPPAATVENPRGRRQVGRHERHHHRAGPVDERAAAQHPERGAEAPGAQPRSRASQDHDTPAQTASANRTAIPSTISRPLNVIARRHDGVIRSPARPATRVSARCQTADAAPTSSTNAIGAHDAANESDVATEAKYTIVSGLIEVSARNRRYWPRGESRWPGRGPAGTGPA